MARFNSRLRKFTARFKPIETHTALMAIWWFIILILPVHAFALSQSFHAMAILAPQYAWGVVALIIGICQFIGMLFNNCFIRTYSLLAATTFWAFVAATIFVGNPASTGTGIYLLIASMTGWTYMKVRVMCDVR